MRILGIASNNEASTAEFIEGIAEAEPTLEIADPSLLIVNVANALRKSIGSRRCGYGTSTAESPVLERAGAVLSGSLYDQIGVPFDESALRQPRLYVGDKPACNNPLWAYVRAADQDDSILDIAITPENQTDEHNAELLRWITQYIPGKVGVSLSAKDIAEGAKAAQAGGCELYVVAGIKFALDYRIVTRQGGASVEIIRPEGRRRRTAIVAPSSDPQLGAHALIVDNKSPKHFRRVTAPFLTDFHTGRLQRVYSAKAF